MGRLYDFINFMKLINQEHIKDCAAFFFCSVIHKIMDDCHLWIGSWFWLHYRTCRAQESLLLNGLLRTAITMVWIAMKCATQLHAPCISSFFSCRITSRLTWFWVKRIFWVNCHEFTQNHALIRMNGQSVSYDQTPAELMTLPLTSTVLKAYQFENEIYL